MTEKQCYHDYHFTNADRFFNRIRKGLRPTIDNNLPQGISILIIIKITNIIFRSKITY